MWVGRCWAFASVLCSSLLQYNATASVGDVVAENLLLLKETWSNLVTEVEDFSFGEIFFSDQWSTLSRWVCYSPLTFEVREHCYDSKLAKLVTWRWFELAQGKHFYATSLISNNSWAHARLIDRPSRKSCRSTRAYLMISLILGIAKDVLVPS